MSERPEKLEDRFAEFLRDQSIPGTFVSCDPGAPDGYLQLHTELASCQVAIVDWCDWIRKKGWGDL